MMARSCVFRSSYLVGKSTSPQNFKVWQNWSSNERRRARRRATRYRRVFRSRLLESISRGKGNDGSSTEEEEKRGGKKEVYGGRTRGEGGDPLLHSA